MTTHASDGPTIENSAQGGPLSRLLVLDQPFFADMTRGRQTWESVGGALVAGALCGVGISVAPWFYFIGVAISFLGGLGVGAQHRSLRGAEIRAFVGGAVWALAVVGVHQIIGNAPVIPLPHPTILFLPWGIIPSCAAVTIMFFVARKVRAGHSR